MAKKKILLNDIAYGRSGDKGDTCNIGLIARDEKSYEILKKYTTADKVKAHFKDEVKGKVDRYEVPNLMALEFVMQGALGGGGSRSLRVDTLGKVMYAALLRMEIEVEDKELPNG